MQYAAAGPQGSYPAMGSETVAAPPPSQSSGFDARPAPAMAANVPAGFDVAGFLHGAKMNYMKLQIANDRGDLEVLREFTTDERVRQIVQLFVSPQDMDRPILAPPGVPAERVAALAGEDDERVLLAAALAVRSVRGGSVGLDLDALVAAPVFRREVILTVHQNVRHP